MITGLLQTTGLTGRHTNIHTSQWVPAVGRVMMAISVSPDVHIDWQPHTETDPLLSSPLLLFCLGKMGVCVWGEEEVWGRKWAEYSPVEYQWCATHTHP